MSRALSLSNAEHGALSYLLDAFLATDKSDPALPALRRVAAKLAAPSVPAAQPTREGAAPALLELAVRGLLRLIPASLDRGCVATFAINAEGDTAKVEGTDALHCCRQMVARWAEHTPSYPTLPCPNPHCDGRGRLREAVGTACATCSPLHTSPPGDSHG